MDKKLILEKAISYKGNKNKLIKKMDSFDDFNKIIYDEKKGLAINIDCCNFLYYSDIDLLDGNEDISILKQNNKFYSVNNIFGYLDFNTLKEIA